MQVYCTAYFGKNVLIAIREDHLDMDLMITSLLDPSCGV